MATPRTLTRPPIVEALIEFRASIAQPEPFFDAFAKTLDGYPNRKKVRGVRATLGIKDGVLIPPNSEDLGFQGIRAESADGISVVQLGQQGLIFNNLKSYVGWDALVDSALTVWSSVVAQLPTTVVERVGVRYINQLALPIQEDEHFSKFLNAAPELPEGAPQLVSESLSRTVGHERSPDGFDWTVIVTQLVQTPTWPPVVTIDLDVFKSGKFADLDSLRAVLQELRILKNRTFFALLTDRAVDYYV